MPDISTQFSLTHTGAFRPVRPLTHKQGSEITYLLLGITDRCNLRCIYCMPEKGIELLPHDEILTFEELSRLAAIFCTMGGEKVRLTGGEPFARLDAMSFMHHLKRDVGGLDLQQMLRTGKDDGYIEHAIRGALQEKHIDGRAAEKNNRSGEPRSMASIGG